MANRKYEQQLKDNVINEVIIGDHSAAQAARDHELSMGFMSDSLSDGREIRTFYADANIYTLDNMITNFVGDVNTCLKNEKYSQ